jgi:hypothetical protein
MKTRLGSFSPGIMAGCMVIITPHSLMRAGLLKTLGFQLGGHKHDARPNIDSVRACTADRAAALGRLEMDEGQERQTNQATVPGPRAA